MAVTQEQSNKPSGPKVYTVKGETIVLDEDGFLVNPESWSEELAAILAQEEGLPELNDVHWRILRFVRTFYLTNGKVPLNAELKKATGLTMTEIQSCFPGGIRKMTRRLAGLPYLKGCA